MSAEPWSNDAVGTDISSAPLVALRVEKERAERLREFVEFVLPFCSIRRDVEKFLAADDAARGDQ